jgi:hypothetical protein
MDDGTHTPLGGEVKASAARMPLTHRALEGFEDEFGISLPRARQAHDDLAGVCRELDAEDAS